jgi:hypothetical protein
VPVGPSPEDTDVNADALIATPGPITYCTPHTDMDSLIEVDEIAELNDDFNDLEFSAHGSSSQVEVVGFNVPESNSTNLEVSQNETGLLSAIVDSDADKVESSLETVTEKRSAAVNEHKEKQARTLLSDFSTRPKSVPIQKTDDGDNARKFVGPKDLEVNYPVIDEPKFVTNAPPSIELQIEEANLSALSQAIDECFREGWGIDVTLSQLLSMLTYVQALYPGKEQPPKWLLSYQEMEPLATLAKKFIESRELSAAVSLYKGVIVDTWVLLKDVVYPNSLRALEQLLVLSPEYLHHEMVILQIVVAGYLKIQLATKPSLEAASQKILGVIARLRSIYKTKLSPSSAAIDRVLGSLSQIINRDCLGRFPHALRYELLFYALDLANCYSQGNEFEAADALFHLRSATSTCQYSGTDLSHLYQRILGAEQMFPQHHLRRRSSPYRPRVRRWSHMNPPPAFLGRASLSHEEAIRFEVASLCRSLICKREVFSHLTVTDDAPHAPLLNKKESANIAILDSETDTGFPTNSIRSQQSVLGLCRARRAPLPKRKEGLKVVDLESETDTGFTTSSTRSYRYGVTFSDSDVPGIDISRYLVQ